MKRFSCIFIFFAAFIQLKSQQSPNIESFVSPLKIPLYLSGNFAELRSDHFHSGIDIKTQGAIGKSLYSIEEGFVSRIKIQTNGYGKSIYIQHPGGYTSVYGHLSDYNNTISTYVKKYQYQNHTHALDIYPAINELSIKKGDFIGYSGNSGSSGGPHLHFEIRKTSNQHPLNVQKFGYKITDNVSPRISNFYLYSFSGEGKRRKIASRKKIGLNLEENVYRPKMGDTIFASSPTSFGMEVYDFMNGTSNRYGIYYIKMYIDNELMYHFQTDEFSFSETRYINSHIDYALRKRSGENVQLLFRLPGNQLSMNKTIRDDGVIYPDTTKLAEVDIQFGDFSGNQRRIHFFLKKETGNNSLTIENESGPLSFAWDKSNSYENHMLKISIPSGSLYEDTKFNYERTERSNNYHPWYHTVHSSEVPLHLPMKLSILCENIPPDFLSKACIVSYDEKEKILYEGGKIENDNWLTVTTRNFGKFGIEIDTLSPQIIPVNFRKNENLTGKKELRLIIRDNLSNISSYKGFIDSEWALFEYDPKDDLLTYQIDNERIESGKNHEVEIYIEDGKGNQSIFHSSFYW